MKLELVATCLFGLEKLLGEEIDALGLTRLDTMDGRVTFEGTEADIPRANIALRCAERVFVHLGAFPASSFAELFDGVRALPLEQYIGKNDAFPVKGYCHWSLLDNFEWQKGFSMTFGLIAVDRKTQTRFPKESLSYLGTYRSST